MSDLLTIGSSGITAYQRALATVSNNIANSNTDGYSRQDVTLSANAPKRMGADYLGTGTSLAGIRRQYDAFVDLNLRTSNSELQAQKPLVSYVNRLIDIMGDKSIGLTSAMNQFFGSARDLATSPASTVQRSAFLRDADGLASRFRELDSQFTLLDNESRQAIETDVGKINSLTTQLAQLNRQMTRHISEIDQPAELLDQRDKLLRELSTLTGVKTRFESSGAVLVSVGDVLDQGVLVNGSRSRDIGLAKSEGGDSSKLRFVIDPYGTPQSLPNLLSGSIGGALAFREQVLKPAVDTLDSIAQSLSQEVNAAHRTGIDLEGRLGGDLFAIQPGEGGAAGRIQLAFNDTSRVAAAGQFRITDNPLNTSLSQASVAWSAPQYAGPTALAGDLALGQVPQVAVQSFTVGGQQAFAGLGLVPLGTRDLTLTLQQPQAGQSLQVLTRDGRHLLGAALSPQLQSQLMNAGTGMEAGATYSAASLGQGYPGMDLFLGARADVQRTPRFSEELGKLAAPDLAPAVLQGREVPAGLSGPIASGTYTLNGVSLGALAQTGPLTAQNVADWLNGASATTGVSATVVGGALRLARPDGDVTRDIRLGLGPQGQASDLTRLGFDQAVYLNGTATDDLLVFVTTTSSVPSSVQAQAQFQSGTGDLQQALRQRSLELKFTSTSRYQILDQSSGSVLAERDYDPSQDSIEFRGLSLRFSTAPAANDRYVIDNNLDGIGNNEAMLKLAGLENERLVGGDLTLTEAYIEKVNDVGNLAQQAKISQDALQVVYDQATQSRDAISGVSLDEEASNLVRFQQAYQANAKVMQTAMQLFDAILTIR